ncbi:MAG: outer membrane protein assembly factor BamE [Thiobacillus sp.]
MRHFLLSILLLGLVAGCGSTRLGPHRIDVQQGNAIDQENIVRLKPGLSRSQVRFLLGTPLVIDPFRNDRWDYIYTFHKAGKLTEEKRVTLHFDGDLLARIEGDVPAVAALPTTIAQSAEVTPPQPKLAEAVTPVELAVAVPRPAPVVVPAVPVQPAAQPPAPTPVTPIPVATPLNVKSAPAPVVATGVVTPLPSPKNVPTYVDPRPPAEFALQAETNVAQLKPDVIPPFPDPVPASATPQSAVGDTDAPILQALEAWAAAWGRRDEVKYLAAYADSFVPQGGGSRADWAQRRRLLLGIAKNIEVRIDSPSVERAGDGGALLTFNQFYRSESYRDAVVKQLRMVEQQGRWLIVEEKVLSVLRSKP